MRLIRVNFVEIHIFLNPINPKYVTLHKISDGAMKQFGYTENHLPSYGERQEEIDEAKSEDGDLPVFSREVPVSSERHITNEGVSVEYSWKEPESRCIKVKNMLFRESEKLGDLYRIGRKDGIDRVVIRKNERTYLLRKTSSDIAKALYRIAGKIGNSVEKIVGYLKTLFGSNYVISVVESDAWTFDHSLCCDNVKCVDIEDMELPQKKKISDLIVEKLSSLHSRNLILGNFSLDNLLIHNNGLKFTDLRKLRASRKKTFITGEFMTVMRYLLSAGMMEKEDIPHSVAYYSTENDEGCREWYVDTYGKKPKDEVEIISAIESKLV